MLFDGVLKFTGQSLSVAGQLIVKEDTSNMMMFALISSQLKLIRLYAAEANTSNIW
jgi:hypothetical protein